MREDGGGQTKRRHDGSTWKDRVKHVSASRGCTRRIVEESTGWVGL